MQCPKLIDFTTAEEAMVKDALEALENAGYDTSFIKELIRVEMPPTFRAMTLGEGAVLSTEAFQSQDWLNHVLEEELIHLVQKAKGLAEEFGPGTALELELDVNDIRKFLPPES